MRYAFVAMFVFVIFVKINKTQYAYRVNVNAKKKQIVIYSFKIFDKFIEIIYFRCAKFFHKRFFDAYVKSLHIQCVCCANKNRFCEKINFCDSSSWRAFIANKFSNLSLKNSMRFYIFIVLMSSQTIKIVVTFALNFRNVWKNKQKLSKSKFASSLNKNLFIVRATKINIRSFFLQKIQNLNKIVWTLINFYRVVINAFLKRKRNVVLTFFNTILIFWSTTSNQIQILICFFSIWIWKKKNENEILNKNV